MTPSVLYPIEHLFLSPLVMTRPKRRTKPKVHVYADDDGSYATEPTSSHVPHISYHAQHGSVTVSRQFIKTNPDLGSSDYEAFPLDTMWLPDESHTLQSMEVSGEADPLTTSVTPEPFRRQVYTSVSPSRLLRDQPIIVLAGPTTSRMDSPPCHVLRRAYPPRRVAWFT